MTVSVNGKTLGQTGPHSYFHLNVPPGEYTVESHTENLATLSITAEAEKNYYVWQEVKMGMWAPKSKLQQVEEEGRVQIEQTKMLATSVTNNDFAPSKGTVSQRLLDLEQLRDEGVITQSDFQKKKEQLLEEL